MNLIQLVSAHHDVAASTTIGATITAANLTRAEIPEGMPEWARWVGGCILTFGPMVIRAWSSWRVEVARQKDERAARLETDKDPSNDAEAAKLREQAAGERALAAGARSLAGDRKGDRE